MNRKHYLYTIGTVLLLAILVRVFVFESFFIRGDSMAPNILPGELVLVNKMAYWFSEPVRGEIVVTETRGESIRVIKRIIGLPYERVEIEEGEIYIKEGRLDEGTRLEEGYLSASGTPERGLTVIKLDPGEYYALGDNRGVSLDSRDFGPIDKWDIRGRVFAKFDFGTLGLTFLR